MQPGDLVQTVIRKVPVVLIKKESKHVWAVLTPDGIIQAQWDLNLEPHGEIKK